MLIADTPRTVHYFSSVMLALSFLQARSITYSLFFSAEELGCSAANALSRVVCLAASRFSIFVT